LKSAAAGFVNRMKVGPTVLAAFARRPSEVAWPKRFAPFLCAKGGDIEVEIRREPIPRPGDLLFESEGVWRAYRQPDSRLLLTFRVGRTIYKAALLDRAIKGGEVYFPRPLRGAPAPRSALQFPLDEMLFQHRWAQDGLLEVHSCGVLDRSGVLLFAGHSGAGKSTLARIWRQHAPAARILSDDRVLLDPRRPAGVRAFGTPWHGTGRFGSPASGGLRALFFLEQSAVSEAVRLHPAEAAARLFTRSFPPIWDRDATERVVKACGDVAERAPAFLLRFRKDESVIDIARQAGQ
jgi:hypothetical protein